MELRALLFDDDEVVRMICSAAMQKRGYDVYGFPEATKCPAFQYGGCPCPEGMGCAEVIVADINMQSSNGIELFEQLMKFGCRVNHFALMSGWWSDDELGKARELGCATLKKPYVLDELNRWLDECEASTDPQRKLWGSWFREEQ